MVELPIKLYLQSLAKQANAATRALSLMPGHDRALALMAMAEQLEASMEDVLAAHQQDLDAIPKERGMEEYRKARKQISVTEDNILDLVAFIRRIAEEPDPTGRRVPGLGDAGRSADSSGSCPYRGDRRHFRIWSVRGCRIVCDVSPVGKRVCGAGRQRMV